NPNISNYPGVIAMGNNLSLSPLYNPSGLVGYWKLDGDTIDSSGYGNNGTWNGTSTERYAGGKVGSYSGNFNGVNDYITCNGDNVLKLESNFSISAWVNFDQLKDYGYVVLKSSGGGNISVNYRLMSGATTINGLIANGVTSNVVSGSEATNGVGAGSWVLLTFTTDGSNLKFYVDGKFKFSAVQTITPVGSSHAMNISNSVNGVDGQIDDVRVYNRALSAAEIAALYNATK
ncbi:MAG: Polymorphic membrane protein, partial [Parcubacteria group bacterium LiPW_15]